MGTIYAPHADFTLGGGGKDTIDFVGSSVTKTVKMNGHYKFHYDENLAELSHHAEKLPSVEKVCAHIVELRKSGDAAACAKELDLDPSDLIKETKKLRTHNSAIAFAKMNSGISTAARR